MKIKILPSALADLDRGRQFYCEQEEVLGDYFLDSLFSDIDSLVPESTGRCLIFIDYSQSASRTQSTTS